MVICDEAWEKFVLYSLAIVNGSKDYNNIERRGHTQIGNKDADLFDVFNFWREEVLHGHPYSKEYLDNLQAVAIQEEPYGIKPR